MADSYRDYQVRRSPPWLQDEDGAAWEGAFGQAKDDIQERIRLGVVARFPDFSPDDGLAAIGQDRQLPRAPGETSEAYAARLKGAWGFWELAGSHTALLIALKQQGFWPAVIVQDNGRYTVLNDGTIPATLFDNDSFPTDMAITVVSTAGFPTSGYLILGKGTPTEEVVSYTTLNAVVFDTSALQYNHAFGDPVALYAEAVKTPADGWIQFGLLGNSIIKGRPGWRFHDIRNTYFSRYMIVFPGPLPASLLVTGRATFSASTTAVVVWSTPWDDTNYNTAVTQALSTSGSPMPSIAVDGTTLSKTGCTVRASTSCTGTVDLVAWLTGSIPFCSPSISTVARLNQLVQSLRPSEENYMGAVALVNGQIWGWPKRKWGASGLKWTRPTSVLISP